MRRVVTFFLLVGMLGGFGVLMYARPAPPELAPSADAKPEGADAKAEAAASESGGADTDADTDTDGGDEAAAPAEKDDEVKVVRVAGLGWELLAPGVLANDGLDPGEGSAFTKGGSEAHFAAVADTDYDYVRSMYRTIGVETFAAFVGD